MSNPFLYTKNPSNKFEAQQNINYWWFEGMGGCPENTIEANWNTFIREMKREANKELSYFH